MIRLLRVIVFCFFLGVAYRFRGGGYITTGSDTICRLAWALCLALAFGYLSSDLWGALSLIFTGFLMVVVVPHGFAQNAGTWGTPAWVGKPKIKERWPCAWMPQWTLEGWASAPSWQKQLYDFAQMGCVGFFRGLIAFTPIFIIGGLTSGIWAVSSIIWGVLAITILQPTSYQLGTHNMPKSLEATLGGGSWNEMLTGISWTIAIESYLLGGM